MRSRVTSAARVGVQVGTPVSAGAASVWGYAGTRSMPPRCYTARRLYSVRPAASGIQIESGLNRSASMLQGTEVFRLFTVETGLECHAKRDSDPDASGLHCER